MTAGKQTPVTVRLEGVRQRYGDRAVLDGMDLEAMPGELLTLIGASGCGKTTCLRLIAGFLRADAGSVSFDGRDIRALAAHERDVGFVFQSYALFPHLDVARNVAFGLRYRRIAKREAAARLRQALALARLEGLETRLPAQLSGGQRQRVALARAVAIEPKVLLLDEPLAALDANLRAELQGEIRRIQRESGITTIMVTHDQKEAMAVSDRIAILRDGRVSQHGTPRDLYLQPANDYVARFLGIENLLDVEVQAVLADGIYVVRGVDGTDGTGAAWRCVAAPGVAFLPGERATLAFRADAGALGHERDNRIVAQVHDVGYAGSSWTLGATLAHGVTIRHNIAATQAPPAVGENLPLSWAATDCLLLPREA